ncbi:MAG: TerB family tellurite resistance protein [Acidobacteria bacterium]|nr:TerB family tellurite resistance protein [Acidobacteriota bacterium]
MAILDFLGLTGVDSGVSGGASPEADAIRHIVAELEALPEDRARYLAAFAYVLGRAAHADSDVSPEETRKMEEIVRVLGHLPEPQAVLVVEMAKHQVRLFGGDQNYLVTRRFRDLSTSEQRIELLECVFAVSAADASITVAEESEARRISQELGLDHTEFVRARAAYVEHLEALRAFRRQRTGAPPDVSGAAES